VAASRENNSLHSRKRNGQSGQALLEFALVATTVVILALGVVDLSRAIFDKEVLSDLARTGSNLASRGPCSTLNACLTTAANAVITEPSDLNMAFKGRVIVTAVQADSKGATTIIGQVSQGGISGSSKVGAMGGAPTLPATTPAIPPPNQTIYVTEVFYSFTPITPIGNFINAVFPSPLYDVAYF
jgi:hypothetical protein